MHGGTEAVAAGAVTAGFMGKLKSVFQEWQHPRDRQGQFIEVGQEVDVAQPGTSARVRGTVVGFNEQGIQVQTGRTGNYAPRTVAARDITIAPESLGRLDASDNSGASSSRTPEEWKQHYADAFAAQNKAGVSTLDPGVEQAILDTPMGTAKAVGPWADMDLSDDDTAARVAEEQDAIRAKTLVFGGNDPRPGEEGYNPVQVSKMQDPTFYDPSPGASQEEVQRAYEFMQQLEEYRTLTPVQRATMERVKARARAGFDY